MNIVILTLYIAIFTIVIFIILYNRKKIKILEQSIGRVYFQWSNWFNLSYWQGWLRLAVFLGGIVLIFHWLILYSHENYGHAYIMALLLAVSFYHRWKIKFGEKGIVISMKVLYWNDLTNWRTYTIKKNTFLEITFQTPPREKVIKIPSQHAKEIHDILTKVIPERA